MCLLSSDMNFRIKKLIMSLVYSDANDEWSNWHVQLMISYYEKDVYNFLTKCGFIYSSFKVLSSWAIKRLNLFNCGWILMKYNSIEKKIKLRSEKYYLVCFHLQRIDSISYNSNCVFSLFKCIDSIFSSGIWIWLVEFQIVIVYYSITNKLHKLVCW